MKKSAIAFLVCAGLTSAAMAGPTPAAKYTVYCTRGKIEVDMRTPDQMRSARGNGNTYPIKTYDHLSDANKHAQSMGGVGAPCKK